MAINEADRARRRNIILGAAMVASLWLHVLGLALFQYADPVPATPVRMPLALEIELPPSAPDQPPAADMSEPGGTTAGAVQAPGQSPSPETTPVGQNRPPTPVGTSPNQDPAATDQPDDGQPHFGPRPDEATISIESQAPAYVSYLAQIKAAVKSRWIFPPEAREKRLIGRLRALFTVDRNGMLLKIMVEETSGRAILDHAALEAVRGAAPFPPFPEHIQLERLNIKANFDYRIRYIKLN